MTLYESLAQTFIDDIVSERLPIGSRLPALRQLAQQQGVSLTTASKAYDCLQEGGWIYARPQAGYFVASRSEVAEFPTLKDRELPGWIEKRFRLRTVDTESGAAPVEAPGRGWGIAAISPALRAGDSYPARRLCDPSNAWPTFGQTLVYFGLARHL